MSPPTRYFAHVQETGGTTLWHRLARHFDNQLDIELHAFARELYESRPHQARRRS